jgi:3-oxoacyl-[acyl-carrier protein] reductase
VQALFAEPYDFLVHCACIRARAPLQKFDPSEFDDAVAISGRAAVIAAQAFANRVGRRGGSIVLVGALERMQSLPLPPAFAAAQGMLGPLVMSLAKELGPDGILVNLVAGGVTGQGVTAELDPTLVEHYLKLSALRRLGTPDEIARAVVFLALDNRYMTGKTLAVNGGI